MDEVILTLLPHHVTYRGRDFWVSAGLWRQGRDVVATSLEHYFTPENKRRYWNANVLSPGSNRFEPDIEDTP